MTGARRVSRCGRRAGASRSCARFGRRLAAAIGRRSISSGRLRMRGTFSSGSGGGTGSRGAKLPPVLVTVDEQVIEIEPVDLPIALDEVLQSWDLTFKSTDSSDFVAGAGVGQARANKYLLDYALDRMDVIGTMQAIGRFTGRWPSATAKLIEDKANGPAVITMLKNKITGLIAVEPEGGKVSRAYAAQPEVEAGNVFLPHPALHGWVDEFVGRVRRSRMRRTMMMWMRSRRRLSAGRV